MGFSSACGFLVARSKSVVVLVVSVASAAALFGCGGGGGSADTGASSGTVTAAPTISGLAAFGAPVTAAAIKVFDATGAQVGSGTSGSDGKFAIKLDKTGTPPYVLQLGKDEITLYAIHPESSSGVANITPLSDAVVAMVSPTGTPSGLVAAMAASSASAPTAAAVTEKQEVVAAAIAPVAAAAGATSTNLFKSSFEADGTGADKVLDSVTITRTADGSSKSANVQITVKTATNPEAAETSPPVINLTSASNLEAARTEAKQVGTISAADLASKEAASLYMGLIANLNRCYADGPDKRTNGSDTVTSDACKKVFLNNDPTQYLNSGQGVRKGGQFSGMFTYTGEVKFLPVDKAYLVQDLNGTKSADKKGRAIVALSWINEDGNRENIMLYVTRYSLGSEDLLGLSGDRNRYPVAIMSHNQKREFPLRGSALSNLDYVQAGYLIGIRDTPSLDGAKPKIDYVSVTTPSGKVMLLASAPGGAARDLAICTSKEVVLDPTTKIPTAPLNRGAASGRYECTGTSKTITFAQRFVDSKETRVPSDIYLSGILRPLDSNGSPYTPASAELKNFPSTGLWKMRFHFVDSTTYDQRVWSVARPMTVEELMGPDGPDAVMPTYTAATLEKFKSLKSSQTAFLQACWPNSTGVCDPDQSPVPAPTTGGLPFAWASGSRVPVTSIWASGRRNDDGRSFISSQTGSTAPYGTAPTWDDQLTVLSTRQEALLPCSRQSASDSHCATSVASGAAGDFNPKTWMSYSELYGRDAEQRGITRSFNWYQPRKDASNTPF